MERATVKRKLLPALAALLLLALLTGGCAYFGKGTEIIVQPLSGEEARSLPAAEGTLYILNTRSHRFHLPDCSSVPDILPANRGEFTGSRLSLIEDGYSPCSRCAP